MLETDFRFSLKVCSTNTNMPECYIKMEAETGARHWKSPLEGRFFPKVLRKFVVLGFTLLASSTSREPSCVVFKPANMWSFVTKTKKIHTVSI